MPTITVRLFAVLAERIGRDTEALSTDSSLTVAGLLDLLKARHPEQARVIDQCRVAVNREFKASTDPVAPGDEVAIIPPISGG